ncbi:MAG: hypothetical protein ACOX6V_04450, partial [Patescibacteria group bacterium]
MPILPRKSASSRHLQNPLASEQRTAFNRFLLFLLITLSSFLLTIFALTSLLWPSTTPLSKDLTISLPSKGQVLADQDMVLDGILEINVTTEFNDDVIIKKKRLVVEGELVAPNVVYELEADEGIEVLGGQIPVIKNAGVLSLEGKTGNLVFEGDGIGITTTDKGVKFSNEDAGSAQKIFKRFNIGGTEITAGSNNDVITFKAGSNITFSTSGNEVTLTSSAPSSDWLTSGTTLTPVNANYSVGVGTTAPLSLFSVGSGSGFQVNDDGEVVAGIWQGTAIDLVNYTSGNYVASITNGNGITGGDGGSKGAVLTLGISLLNTQDSEGLNASRSGLEFGGAGGNQLTLLQGCSNEQMLKWDEEAHQWVCANDLGGVAAIINVKEGTTTYTQIDTLDFAENEFDVSKNVNIASVTLDFVNSGITRSNQNETISGTWTFSGGVNLSTLNASSVIFTDGSKNLTTTGTVTTAQGGTGLSTYTKGDLVYSSADNVLSKLAVGSENQVLTVSDQGVPYWMSLPAGGTVTSVATGNGLTGGTITDSGTISVNAPTCNGTEKLQWNGTAFVCSSDVDTTYTASNGLTLNGTEFELGGTLSRLTTLDLNSNHFAFTGTGN